MLPRRPGQTLLGFGLLLAACCLLARPGLGHEISLTTRQGLLRDVLSDLERRTGYVFRLAVTRDIEEKRRDFNWQARPLARVLNEVAESYGCDIFSVDSSGFFVVPAQKGEKKEVPAGPYRVRSSPVVALDDAGQAQVTVIVAAPDDLAMDSIAGLSGDLRILDSFGRALVSPSAGGLRRITSTRSRLTEYSHRVPLSLPDNRASRLRSISGAIVLYQKVTPLRFEFPISPAGEARTIHQMRDGVDVRFEKWEVHGGHAFTASCRLSWPQDDTRDVVGRGISRTPQPYLVDARGRVYRDAQVQRVSSSDEEGRVIQEQTFRFESVEAAPERLVYDVLLRQGLGRTLPFRLSDVPLPNVDGSLFNPELRPFYARAGGTLTFQVLDRERKPLEGDVALALARREGAGWSGWRWIETTSDEKGWVRLEHLRPGEYRVKRVFRFSPMQSPAAPASAAPSVTVSTGKETSLPVLQLPVAGPEP